MDRKIKSIEELTIRDNFMFVKVSVVGEAFQQSNPNKKCVRFDIMVKEDGNGIGRVFDLEMQMVDTKELPLRARYYQGVCDTETLGSSHRYKELKEQYIVFLCPKDIFGKDRPIYEFENREKNDHSLTLGDLTYKIFGNFVPNLCGSEMTK